MDAPGAYHVQTSLAQVMVMLKQLGRLSPETLQEWDPLTVEDVQEYLDQHDSQLGEMSFVRHSGTIDGTLGKWEEFPKPLGSDKAEWKAVSVN